MVEPNLTLVIAYQQPEKARPYLFSRLPANTARSPTSAKPIDARGEPASRSRLNSPTAKTSNPTRRMSSRTLSVLSFIFECHFSIRMSAPRSTIDSLTKTGLPVSMAYEIGQDPWRSLGIQLVLLEDAGPCKVARNFGPAGGHDCGFCGHGAFRCVWYGAISGVARRMEVQGQPMEARGMRSLPCKGCGALPVAVAMWSVRRLDRPGRVVAAHQNLGPVNRSGRATVPVPTLRTRLECVDIW